MAYGTYMGQCMGVLCILCAGFMGSLVSFQWSPDTGPQQNGDMLFSNSQKRQLFTQTGV